MTEPSGQSLRPIAIVLLTALVALGPISTDVYLPSLPSIGRYFAVDQAETQLTLSVFLIGFASAMLIYGPLSDRFGRRPVLLGGIALFATASVLCAVAPTIETLIGARFLQALGACAGPVLCRAVVRDVFGAAGAARVLSYLSAAVALAPAIGPMIGGVMETWFGWRAQFWGLTVYGILGLAAAIALLPETNRHRDPGAFHPFAMARTYRMLIGHRRYFGFVLVATFGYSGIFCFISGSSFVFIDVLGLSPQSFGMCFGVIVVGYIIGAIAGGRLTKRFGIDRMVLTGTAVALTSSILLTVLALTVPQSAASVIVPFFFHLVGIGMTLPNAQAGAIGPFPRAAGAAAALLGFIQMIVAAGVGAILGQIGTTSTLPMCLMILAMSLLLVASYWWMARPTKKAV